MRTRFFFQAASICASLFAFGCGSDPDNSSFDVPGTEPPSLNPGANDGGSLKTPAGDAAAPGAECAKSSAAPTPIPVELVFMFDRSGSMNENGGLKWSSCKAGLKAFFADPASKGVEASLQFFPALNASQCTESSYATPAVPMQALPENTLFAAAMAASGPGGAGGTPTLPAVAGSLQYAKQIALKHPTSNTAIVLVTDGDPNGCNSTVQAVSVTAASAKKAGIPVFVVGIGNVANLDAIALAGGTSKATIVSTNSAAQTLVDFQKALNAIRGASLSCEYQIPALPDGATIDQVNVVFTPSGGSPQTLAYDATCSSAQPGWHYDNVTTPTKIILCKSTCDNVQKDAKGKIDLVFGCATKGGIPR